MNIFDPFVSGNLSVSGSAHISGGLTVLGTINATISGTTSEALNSQKLNNQEASYYAITGSNIFKANQTITGSLYVTNDIILNGQSYTAQTSGTSGTSGSSGSSGTAGTSGSSGSSGTSGSSGSSGTAGTSGTSGSSGSSGTSGSSGSSGTSGTSGSSGSSGTSGSSGSSGTSGSSGSSGTSGSSGSSGTAGTSGSSGSSGTTTVTNAAADRVITSEGGVTINGEANFTFNGTTAYINGALGVGTSTPTTTGLIRATNDVIAYFSSDERLKENFELIQNPLEKLQQINGYSFDWIPMEGVHENEGHDIGVKAQEIEVVLPELVTTRDNGYKAVKYEKLVSLLIETNKELLKRIEALESKLK